jgi:hypothetical protein
MNMSDRKQRVLDLFAEWKKDRLAFADRYDIPITLEVGRDPEVGVMKSIAEYVLGKDGWVVAEVIAHSPILIELH